MERTTRLKTRSGKVYEPVQLEEEAGGADVPMEPVQPEEADAIGAEVPTEEDSVQAVENPPVEDDGFIGSATEDVRRLYFPTITLEYNVDHVMGESLIIQS